MSKIANSFDNSRAGQAGSMYAQKHYGRTLAWVWFARHGDWIFGTGFVFFLIWLGKHS